MTAVVVHHQGWVGPPAAPREHTTCGVTCVPMSAALLPRVLQIEQSAHAHPWSPQHFADSLAAGHLALVLQRPPSPWPDAPELLAYLVAMPGVDEVHLLNLTVAPVQQRQGWGRFMLDVLLRWARQQRAQAVWLEVRRSNTGAQTLYTRYGFTAVGLRRRYYPSTQGEREDAVVMKLAVSHSPSDAPSAPLTGQSSPAP